MHRFKRLIAQQVTPCGGIGTLLRASRGQTPPWGGALSGVCQDTLGGGSPLVDT